VRRKFDKASNIARYEAPFQQSDRMHACVHRRTLRHSVQRTRAKTQTGSPPVATQVMCPHRQTRLSQCLSHQHPANSRRAAPPSISAKPSTTPKAIEQSRGLCQ
jgi:hypothetical protein